MKIESRYWVAGILVGGMLGFHIGVLLATKYDFEKNYFIYSFWGILPVQIVLSMIAGHMRQKKKSEPATAPYSDPAARSPQG